MSKMKNQNGQTIPVEQVPSVGSRVEPKGSFGGVPEEFWQFSKRVGGEWIKLPERPGDRTPWSVRERWVSDLGCRSNGINAHSEPANDRERAEAVVEFLTEKLRQETEAFTSYRERWLSQAALHARCDVPPPSEDGPKILQAAKVRIVALRQRLKTEQDKLVVPKSEEELQRKAFWEQARAMDQIRYHAGLRAVQQITLDD